MSQSVRFLLQKLTHPRQTASSGTACVFFLFVTDRNPEAIEHIARGSIFLFNHTAVL